MIPIWAKTPTYWCMTRCALYNNKFPWTIERTRSSCEYTLILYISNDYSPYLKEEFFRGPNSIIKTFKHVHPHRYIHFLIFNENATSIIIIFLKNILFLFKNMPVYSPNIKIIISTKSYNCYLKFYQNFLYLNLEIHSCPIYTILIRVSGG